MNIPNTDSLAPYSGVLDYLDQDLDQITKTLLSWCAINSGSDNLAGLAKMADVYATAFGALDGELARVASAPMKVVDDLGNEVDQPIGDMIHIVKRPDAPIKVLFVGHYDTVFGPDHPFQSEKFLDPTTVNAPGSADMKGGLLIMLLALQAIERSALAQRIGYEIILNADEEIGSHGSSAFIEAAAKRAQFACVFEPSLPDGTLVGARKGSGNFSVVFRGRAAHAGREHHLGRNALVAAADFAREVSGLTGAREGLTVNVGRIDGGGALNVVPELGVVRFNLRVEEQEDAAWFEAEAKALVETIAKRHDLRGDWHGKVTRPPKPMTPALQSFFESLDETGMSLGIDVKWTKTGGCCDGNNIAAAGIPVIDTLGVIGGKIHSDQEYTDLTSIIPRAKLTALLLLKIADGRLPNPGLVAQERE